MGYLKIILVGLLWALCALLSVRGWYTMLITLLAFPVRRLRPYAEKLLTADDQYMNAMLNGNEDHTISGRVGHRVRTKPNSEYRQAMRVINALFHWQKDKNGNRNHCFRSIEYDEV